MEKKELLYEGKAKKIFRTDDNSVFWVEYLDQATALNGVRKDSIQGKGALNNQITSLIFEHLKQVGIRNHFIRFLSKNEQLINSLEMIPLEVVIRNLAAGSFVKRLGVEEGLSLDFPILEFYYKEDRLDDPLVNEEHIKILKLATATEIEEIKELSYAINSALIDLFAAINIQLVDFKLEFGKRQDGTILLADEISPDTCRLWDVETRESLDKDIYRKNLGEMVPVYQEVLARLKKVKEQR